MRKAIFFQKGGTMVRKLTGLLVVAALGTVLMTGIAFVSAALFSLTPSVMAADAPDTSTWVQFSSFSYTGKTTVAPGAGEYLNPIVAGFYPDPSICRVGDDYYLVNTGRHTSSVRRSSGRSMMIRMS
jgi:hypothetical protein